MTNLLFGCFAICTYSHGISFLSGHQYNIPIRIWLRPDHPYVPPLVYVTPTQEMGIQQSQYVDTNGMVYLPYISEWKQVRGACG